jgi:hypothetical protein
MFVCLFVCLSVSLFVCVIHRNLRLIEFVSHVVISMHAVILDVDVVLGVDVVAHALHARGAGRARSTPRRPGRTACTCTSGSPTCWLPAPTQAR